MSDPEFPGNEIRSSMMFEFDSSGFSRVAMSSANFTRMPECAAPLTVECGRVPQGWYDNKLRRVRDLPCGGMRIYLEIYDCRSCQQVKQERLDWLADNSFYTKRFGFHRRCRNSSIWDVAKEHLLDWKTVKALEMEYMREQIKRAGHPRPKVPGVDEISIRKGQTYRIVMSDLERRRAIWFGGEDCSEDSMDEFYAFLGAERSKRVRLAVTDTRKSFRNSANKMALRQLFSSISSTS